VRDDAHVYSALIANLGEAGVPEGVETLGLLVLLLRHFVYSHVITTNLAAIGHERALLLVFHNVLERNFLRTIGILALDKEILLVAFVEINLRHHEEVLLANNLGPTLRTEWFLLQVSLKARFAEQSLAQRLAFAVEALSRVLSDVIAEVAQMYLVLERVVIYDARSRLNRLVHWNLY